MVRPTRSSATGTPSPVTISIPQAPPAGPAHDEPQDREPSFWERLHSIPAEQWATETEKGFKAYLYRDTPRASTKGSAYIKVFYEPFDVEHVRQELGGYDYRAMLNDPSGRMISSVSFSIDAPPLKTSQQQEAAAAAAATPGHDLNSQIIAVMRESQNETRQLLREFIERDRNPAPSAGRGSLAENETVLQGVVTMFTNMLPKQQSPLEMLTQLKGLMAPAEKPTDLLDTVKTLKELGIIPSVTSTGTDMLGQVDSLLAIADKLGNKAGAREPSVLSILAEKAPEIVERVASIMDKWKGVAEQQRIAAQYRYQAAAAATLSPTPAPGQPYAPQPAIPAAARTITVPHGRPAPTAGALDVEPLHPAQTTAPNPAGGPGAAVIAPMLDELDMLKRKVVNAIATDATGADIVSFISVMNDELVNTFVGVSAEDLETFFSQDEVLSPAAALPRFKEVIQEIVEELTEPATIIQ